MAILRHKLRWIIAMVFLAIGLVIFPSRPAYAASGGGCTTAYGVGSCISENWPVIKSDAFIDTNNICNVEIGISSKTTPIGGSDVLYTGCYGAGSHLTGPLAPKNIGKSIELYTFVCINNNSKCIESPTLAT